MLNNRRNIATNGQINHFPGESKQWKEEKTTLWFLKIQLFITVNRVQCHFNVYLQDVAMDVVDGDVG